VLQVHSLVRPASPERIPPLCDVQQSRKWIDRAGRIGVSYRVALPTYSYVTAFDAKGNFLRLAGEGAALKLPAGGTLREVQADPVTIAQLIRELGASRPQCCTGVIWYRLPNDDDELNWRWPTLATVMQGKAPKAILIAQARRSEPNLFEIELMNTGDADAALSCQVSARCAGAKILASDALDGFERKDQAQQQITLRADKSAIAPRLAPGEKRTVGWIRTSNVETEVRADVTPLP
jgi:hypothetical protein